MDILNVICRRCKGELILTESTFHKDVDVLTVTGIVEPHSCPSIERNWIGEGGGKGGLWLYGSRYILENEVE